MNLVAVIPLRGLANGKSRLRGALPDRVRRALIMAMLERVTQAVVATGLFAQTVIVSPDPIILRWAESQHLVALRQESTGLNAALWQTATWAQPLEFAGIFAIHGDLPMITAAQIQASVAALPPAPGLLVVGDRHEFGTTALAMRPVGIAPFRFGEQSYVRHLTAAEARGVQVTAYQSSALAFDLDTPADLRDLALRHPVAFVGLWRAVLRWLPRVANDEHDLLSRALPHPG